jgi:hypothetical protein
MPSPFPGMNPYLEQSDTWEDFHQSFMTHARDVLSGKVGAHYLVKIEVRLYLHELPASERRYFGRADAGISTPAPGSRFGEVPGPVAAPVQLTLPAVDVERHASLEIRDRRNRRLVTVIELLSPTNKPPGPDRDEYLAKRAQILATSTHLVEIDLRRGGERPRPPELPDCDYYVLVSRAESRPQLGFWPISLHDPLPPIGIPLTAPDADLTLDLQALLHHVYDAADYGKYIYGEAPQPPLSEEAAAWAQQFVPSLA